jgi:hypothetical protein
MSQFVKLKLQDWLKDYLDYLDWNELSKNPLAFDLLKQYPEKINWKNLCLNIHPNVIDLLEKNKDKINWTNLSKNPIAIDILKKNKDKFDIFALTDTYTDIRGDFVDVGSIINAVNPELDINKISWDIVLTNPFAIDLINMAFKYDARKKYRRIYKDILDFVRNFDYRRYEKIRDFDYSFNMNNHPLINIPKLCSNPQIVYFFDKYDILVKALHDNCLFGKEYNICWKTLCMNKYAIPIIKEIYFGTYLTTRIFCKCERCNKSYFDTFRIPAYQQLYKQLIDWDSLSLNELAIDLLEENIDKINWSNLSYNKNAIHLLEKYIYRINWKNLSANENAIHLLEKYRDKINWENLSSNKKALPLFKKYPEKVHWNKALLIKDPEIIDFVGTYVKNIQLAVITDNSHVLKVVKSMLKWTLLSKNPFIFERCYEEMAEKFEPLSRELNDYLCDRPHLLPKEYEN